ncbi:MAG: hypothetical protein FWH18_06550 [Marinilabiliaceae bacterium]|nr:hypothetical protein [Marinilabiliaceae bacterium]
MRKFGIHIANKGLLTGSATAILDYETYLYSAFYYDCFGRIVQTKSTNHLGGVEKEYVHYDYTGNPLKKMHIHIKNNTSIKEVYNYEYDYAGRLKIVTHKLNNSATVTITENNYEETGRLHSTENATNETVEYRVDFTTKSLSMTNKEILKV